VEAAALSRPERKTGFTDTKGAAEYLDMTEHALRMRRHRGNGPPFHKKDGIVRYFYAELHAWMLGGR
jgi:hypothetical protein